MKQQNLNSNLGSQSDSKLDLKKGAHIHLMGICGTAMASLAGLLKDLGYEVTGSDSNPYPPMSTQLEKLGIQIQKGYKAENLSSRPDFVIVGNVISANNEEAQELMRLQIPYTSLPKAMGEFIISDRESIVISGTHGKTTTTSLMTWTADQCGLNPGFLVGGIPKNYAQSFKVPEGKYFVIEGDEYDTAFFDKVPKFIHYKPRHVVLTSVEFDHADIYKDLDAVMAAFQRLMQLIPKEGTLIACADDENVMKLYPSCLATSKATYGIKNGMYKAKVISSTELGSKFEVYFHDRSLGVFEINMGGDYNILNATAVVAMADQLKWDFEKLRSAFKSFQGVKRRQEILGEPGGVLVIEDFAHHPTAVRETIRGIQARYPGRKFFSVFEPRSATSRRKVFQSEYLQAFSEAHEVILAKAFDQTKLDQADRFSSEELVDGLKAAGHSAVVLDSADSIVADITNRAKKGDAVLIMSNGGFDGIYQKLIKSLESR